MQGTPFYYEVISHHKLADAAFSSKEEDIEKFVKKGRTPQKKVREEKVERVKMQTSQQTIDQAFTRNTQRGKNSNRKVAETPSWGSVLMSFINDEVGLLEL